MKKCNRSLLIARTNAFQTDRVSRFAMVANKLGLKVTIAWLPGETITNAQHDKIKSLKKLGVDVLRVKPKLSSKSFFRRLLNRLYFQKWLLTNVKIFDNCLLIDLDSFCIVALLPSKVSHSRIMVDVADFIEDNHNIPAGMRIILRAVTRYCCRKSMKCFIPDLRRLDARYREVKNKFFEIKNIPYDNEFSERDIVLRQYNKNEITVFYYGTLSRDRGLDVLVSLAQSHGIIVKVAGQGRYKGVLADTNVKFLGSLSRKELVCEIDNSDYIFVMNDPGVPINKYSDPSKFYESIFRGRPVIVSHDTGISEIVEKKKLGAVAAYDSDDVSDKLRNIEVSDYSRFAKNCVAFRSELNGNDIDDALREFL